jgi:hypothetical protein
MSNDSGAPTGLSEVCWTRTTVGGPNHLGGSVTLGKRKTSQSGFRLPKKLRCPPRPLRSGHESLGRRKQTSQVREGEHVKPPF